MIRIGYELAENSEHSITPSQQIEISKTKNK